ncbi:MAG: hypothetical protein NW207_09930 [Cytophagales bacterium]|nr:hypothetical protein [Cytophagales bacterium]
MKKILAIYTISVMCLASVALYSQCAMCKATVMANKQEQERSRVKAEGLNTGIFYLMVVPYIAFGIVGYMWYRSSVKEKKEAEALMDKKRKLGLV